MGIVRTVTGDIDSSLLGYCLPHEHVLWDGQGRRSPENAWSMWRFPEQLAQIQEYADNGGKSIGEASFSYMAGRDPGGMKAISEATGVYIIASTGTLSGSKHPESLKQKSIDEVADFWCKEIEVGMDDTTIKAGWIKGSSQYMRITEWEEKALRAACRASLRTGAPVHTHTSNGTWLLEQLEIVQDEKLPAENFCEAHVDRNPDEYQHRKLVQAGIYIIYDGPGKAKYWPDSMRIDILKKLVAEGHDKQIMFCNDMGKKEYHKQYGGGPGLNWIKDKWLPRLLDEGFTQENIDNFMIHNPARFYSLKK